MELTKPAKRLNRVLTNDPGLGVVRHVMQATKKPEQTALSKQDPRSMLTIQEKS